MAGAQVEETGPLAGGVGAARRLGCALALDTWREARILLTTDADGRVEPGSVAVIARSLQRAHAVMGRIRPEPAEHRTLPAALVRLGSLENRRDAMLAELGAICAPRPHDPAPRHLFTSGALMAFRRETYLASGGFRDLACDEDTELGARLARLGFRIARPRDAVVTVSCRRAGRAPGGMADLIDGRLGADLDPMIDRTAAQCRRLERLLRAARREGPKAMERMTRLVPGARDALAPPTFPERTPVGREAARLTPE
jgi:hypothetical protein